MAIISHILHPSSLVGESTRSGSRYYVAWQLQSDDERDGAQRCVDYVRRNIVDFGDPYRLGNERDDDAVLTTLRPERYQDVARKLWIVRGTYEIDRKIEYDEAGKLTTDPLRWYDRVAIRETRSMVAAEEGTYWSGLRDVAAAKRARGSKGPIANSAGVPFDPPLERRETHQIVTLTRNLDGFPQEVADVVRDTVCNDLITVRKRFAKYRANWQPLTAMVESLVGEHRVDGGVSYWECALTIALNPRKWRHSILDRGLHAAFGVGLPDPDHPGEVIYARDPRLKDGAAPLRRLVDHEERPLSEPALLDGNGQPLRAGAKEVYLEYAVLVERAWRELRDLGFFS